MSQTVKLAGRKQGWQGTENVKTEGVIVNGDATRKE